MEAMWDTEIVRALYKYAEPNGLTFDIGEKISVHEKGQDGWWKGVIVENGKEDPTRSGWFPATFVTLDDGHEAPAKHELNGNVNGIGDWCTAHAEDGRLYYYNKITHETSWEAPKATTPEDPNEDSFDDLPAPPDSMMESLGTMVPPMPSVSPPSPPHSPTSATSEMSSLTADGPMDSGSSPPAGSPLSSARDRNSIISSASAEELRAHALERASRKSTMTSVKAPKKGSPASSLPSSLHASNDSLSKLSDSPSANRRRKSKASQLRSWYFTLPPAQQGSEQALINSIQVSYCDHFWEDGAEGSGFDVVLNHIQRGKSVCREFAEFFRERALLEDLYARNLARLSKSNLGDQERGTVGFAWRSLKKSLEDEANNRQQFAARLLQELERPLLEYSEGTADRKKELKKLDAMIQEDRKMVASKYKEVDKARAALYERQKNVEAMRSAGNSMKSSDYSKIQKKAVAAADEMRRVVDAYNQSQAKWVEDMILALLELEKIESERIEFVKKRLNSYINFQQKSMSHCEKTSAKLGETIDEVDPIKDRQEFIQRYGTGVVRPVDFNL